MLILQISKCAEAEGSQRPQRHTEHVMLKDAYVAIRDVRVQEYGFPF
jgi:hypothetical protein